MCITTDVHACYFFSSLFPSLFFWVQLVSTYYAVRPTTFWRKTRKSGVSGASYSPASHLVRRSTFLAAGLPFESPHHDLSALCVESRVGFIVVPPEQF